MSRVKAMLAGLAQNPSVLRGLMEDPRGFASLAGLSEAELCALSGVGSAVTALLNRYAGQQQRTPAMLAVPPASVVCRRANGERAGGGQGVAITSIMSLLAVAGAVTALGTVSLVALASRQEDQIP